MFLKQRIIIFLFVFVAMAAIPAVCLSFGSSIALTKESNGKNPDKSSVCKAACAFCENSYSDETIGVVIKIVYTNISNGYTYENSDISDKELYKRVTKLYNSNTELLYINNRKIFIPLAKCSVGKTAVNKKSDSLYPVASPWDCFSNDFNSKNICEGVSADGVDYLIKTGLSPLDALRWYLPKVNDFNNA